MLVCPHYDSVMHLKGGIDVICDGFECACGFEIKTTSNTQFQDKNQPLLPFPPSTQAEQPE